MHTYNLRYTQHTQTHTYTHQPSVSRLGCEMRSLRAFLLFLCVFLFSSPPPLGIGSHLTVVRAYSGSGFRAQS